MEEEKFVFEQGKADLSLQRIQEKVNWGMLEESADLYAEVYVEDADLRELTEAAIAGWPE